MHNRPALSLKGPAHQTECKAATRPAMDTVIGFEEFSRTPQERDEFVEAFAGYLQRA